MTHSILFALSVGIGMAIWSARRDSRVPGSRLALYLVVAMLSHGMLDALTNGGPGIAFFSPVSNARYFFRFRPIAVSPIGVQGVFGARGMAILASEARWILLPAALLGLSGVWWRYRA